MVAGISGTDSGAATGFNVDFDTVTDKEACVRGGEGPGTGAGTGAGVGTGAGAASGSVAIASGSAGTVSGFAGGATSGG